MIDLNAHKPAVAARLERLDVAIDAGADEGSAVPMELARACALGTDVQGEQLMRVLDSAAQEVRRMAHGLPPCDCEDAGVSDLSSCRVSPAIAGALHAMFWLGYEAGIEARVREELDEVEAEEGRQAFGEVPDAPPDWMGGE